MMRGKFWSEIPELYVAVFIIFVAVLGYLSYFFVSRPVFVKKFLPIDVKKKWLSLNMVLFQRAAGSVFLGIIPGAIILVILNIRLKDYGLALRFESSSMIWILGAGAGAFLVSFLLSKFTDNSAIYPQIRIKNWGFDLFMINAMSWAAYLLAYEFLFRGIVLFSSLKAIGYWAAVVLNVILYALAHLPKGKKEVYGAIPFGIVLCLVTLETGTIWAAFAAHVSLALSYDHFSLLSHPDMRYVLRKRGRLS
jgi:membrane protease YdiL (CAAX protease family)